jgi:hypothetical protein
LEWRLADDGDAVASTRNGKGVEQLEKLTDAE